MRNTCDVRRDGHRFACRDCYQEWHVGDHRPACLMPRYADDRTTGAQVGAMIGVAAILGWCAAVGAAFWWLT